MDSRPSRRQFLAATGLWLGAVAGCLGSGIRPQGIRGSGESGPPTAERTLPLPRDRTAIRDAAVSGGPPKDGIPAIEDPAFESAETAADRLAPGDPVFGVIGETEVKAYPQAILVHHEICNDSLDEEPVSVTYCPLTGTAMGFHRGETTFGVSGRLVNNNLIMYDRATETWWPQVLSTAVPGPWNEDPLARSLVGFRVVWTTWERWRALHPETVVLSRDTGHVRNYDSDPYGDYNPRRGYYEPKTGPMFGWLGEADDRFPPKEVFIGARAPDGAVAFHKDGLRSAKLMAGNLGGKPALAVYDPALDTGYVYRNPDGTSYTHHGKSVRGPDGSEFHPADLPLDRVLALDAMWFAWTGFYPDSSVHV